MQTLPPWCREGGGLMEPLSKVLISLRHSETNILRVECPQLALQYTTVFIDYDVIKVPSWIHHLGFHYFS